MKWTGNKCGKNEGNENLKAKISDTDYDISKTNAEYEIFELLW